METYVGLAYDEFMRIRAMMALPYVERPSYQKPLFLLAFEKLLKLSKQVVLIPWLHNAVGYELRWATPIKEWLTRNFNKYKLASP
jgi:hypothetical protein